MCGGAEGARGTGHDARETVRESRDRTLRTDLRRDPVLTQCGQCSRRRHRFHFTDAYSNSDILNSEHPITQARYCVQPGSHIGFRIFRQKLVSALSEEFQVITPKDRPSRSKIPGPTCRARARGGCDAAWRDATRLARHSVRIALGARVATTKHGDRLEGGGGGQPLPAGVQLAARALAPRGRLAARQVHALSSAPATSDMSSAAISSSSASGALGGNGE